jgi:hypothetical protein
MKRRGRRLQAVILGVLGIAAAPALGASFGVQDDRLAHVELDALGRRLDVIAQTGARWTRVDVVWKDIAPGRPHAPANPGDTAYRWDRLDRTIVGLARRKVRPILNVYWGPAWATRRDDYRWAPDPTQYAAFVVALGKRYSGTYDVNGVRLPRVTHFELWNEPNIDLFFRPQWLPAAGGGWEPASPRLYARLVKATHYYMRLARPDALLIVGSLAPTNISRPGGLSIGVKEFIDALVAERIPVMAASQHIYPGAAPGTSRALPSEHGVQEIRRLWSRLRRDVPLYITETGYTSAYTPYRRYQVTEKTQAQYLPQLLRNLSQRGVPVIIWYNLEDNALWPSGLLGDGGRVKPSWNAFRAAVARVR